MIIRVFRKYFLILRSLNIQKDELHVLVGEIKELFNADGEFDILESNMLHALERLIES